MSALIMNVCSPIHSCVFFKSVCTWQDFLGLVQVLWHWRLFYLHWTGCRRQKVSQTVLNHIPFLPLLFSSPFAFFLYPFPRIPFSRDPFPNKLGKASYVQTNLRNIDFWGFFFKLFRLSVIWAFNSTECEYWRWWLKTMWFPLLSTWCIRTKLIRFDFWLICKHCSWISMRTEAALYTPADALVLFTRWQHFVVWNNVKAAILKARHQIESLSLSVDLYLREEHSCQISSQSILKRRSLKHFMKMIAPTRTTTTTTKWVAIGDQFLIWKCPMNTKQMAVKNR